MELNSITDSDGNSTAYQYDPVGRLTGGGVRGPNKALTSYIYDGGGRLRQKIFPNAVQASYDYYADNQIKKMIQLVPRQRTSWGCSHGDRNSMILVNRALSSTQISSISDFWRTLLRWPRNSSEIFSRWSEYEFEEICFEFCKVGHDPPGNCNRVSDRRRVYIRLHWSSLIF